MQVGQRLREVREAKKLSQGDIEKRTGLLRCYTSRVENGHTVPAVETLEKYARAFEVPMYQLFIGTEEEPSRVPHVLRAAGKGKWFGSTRKEEKFFTKFWHLLSKMKERDRTLLLAVAQGMAKRKR